MGSVTIYPNADVAIQTNNDYGAGAGPHLPVGVWSGVTYRSAIRFTAPAWSGWTKITKATLNFWISDHQHVGVRNSTILIRRQPTDDMWTRGEGTYSCNSGFSSSNTTHLASDLTSTSTGEVSFTSGTTANAKKSVNVTTMTQAYFAAKTGQPVYLFLHNSTSDYTELWSRTAGSTYDPYLVIEYEDDTVPNAPTLNSPAAGEVVASQNPTLSWTHNDPQGNPQVSAEVSVNGVNVYTVGSEQSLQVPDALARGSSYDWLVRTADSLGYGAWSAARSMTIAPYVSPVITAHYLVWANGAVRYRVSWNWAPPDGRYATHYRVTYESVDGNHDSGWLGGNPGYYVSTGVAVTENSDRTNVVIWVRDSYGIESTCSPQTWRARYGVVVHRKDLGSIPVSWGTPTIQATIPADSTLMIQYGSNNDAAGDPSQGIWYDTLSSVPKLQFLFYKLTLLPNASDQAPTLHQITIPTNNTVETLDHWKLWHGVAFAPPWSLDSGEYVYGTRSVRFDPDTTLDTWNPGLHSELMQLRAGRSYILSGLMKSDGNSGAYIQLLSEAGSGLVETEFVRETRDWFRPDRLDTYRYRTPVYTSPSDQKVYAYLQTQPQPPASLLIDPDNGATPGGWSLFPGDTVVIENGSAGVPGAGWGNFFVLGFLDPGAGDWAVYVGERLACTPGKRYRMRALAWSQQPVVISGSLLDSNGAFVAGVGGVTCPGDSAWRWFDLDLGVIPAGIASIGHAVNSTGSPGPYYVAIDHVTIYEDYSVTAWFDAIKLEESTVATPWSPGAVGASAVDAGGVQIDGAKGAVFRYRGSSGNIRALAEGGQWGLRLGGDTEIISAAVETLSMYNPANGQVRRLDLRSRGGYLFNEDFSQGQDGWHGGQFPWGVFEKGGLNFKGGYYVAFAYDGVSNSFVQHDDLITVSPGSTIRITFQWSNREVNNAKIRVNPVWVNLAGEEVGYPAVDVWNGVNAWNLIESDATFVVPADVYAIRLRFWNDTPNSIVNLGYIRVQEVISGEASLLNGWQNYDSAVYGAAGWIKDPNGFVHLRGLISQGAPASIAFYLPIGCRPERNGHYPIVGLDKLGVVRINPDGSVSVSGEGVAAWASLDGVSFWTSY